VNKRKESVEREENGRRVQASQNRGSGGDGGARGCIPAGEAARAKSAAVISAGSLVLGQWPSLTPNAATLIKSSEATVVKLACFWH
jgi:hypothetical protein